MQNIILNTDSYKTSHAPQYPEGTQGVFSYIESRGGAYPEHVVFGLQYAIKKYLTTPVTQEDIEEAAVILKGHGVPFNRVGWEYIVNKHGGKLPVRIKAVPEGTVVPIGNAIVTIENTDPECFWLTSYLETMLLRAVWYPTTVATVSWRIKQIIKKYMIETGGDLAGLGFKLHDFGARGVSSLESAGIGDAGHLVNFLGTDTIVGLTTVLKYYVPPIITKIGRGFEVRPDYSKMPGFSIPAAEHSTITCWGRDKEVDAYRNMLQVYGGNGIMAVVSDSYDIFNAADNLWGGELKQEVLNSGAIVVIRPDSGHPASVVGKLLVILNAKFGSTINDKGYKLLNNVRIIQGDGINEDSIIEILDKAKILGFNADNLAFGMGGALLQHMDRDTMQWAMKCSAMKINGVWKDVYKQPKGDSGKNSKRGRLALVKQAEGWRTVNEGWILPGTDIEKNELLTVFEDGELKIDYTFDEVRANAEIEP